MNQPRRTSDRLSLVFGASGYIGSHMVARLRARGVAVRAVSRRAEVLHARQWPGVEVLGADALKPDTLGPALQGVDTAYYLVHSMAAGKEFGRLDLEAARNFARAAARAGVRRIIYLGGLVPEDATSEHILSRRDTGEVLRAGPVAVTEVRAGIIVGPGSAAFEVMRDLVFHLPIMLTPRWVRARTRPIALDNLLAYLIQLAAIDAAAGQIYDAAGPQSLTYEQMMRVLAEVAGKRRPLIVPVPVLSPRLSSYWLKYVTSVPTNIARALIEGLKHDFDANTEPLQRLVPQPLMDFRSSVEAAFEAERRSQVEASWAEGAYAMPNKRSDYSYYAKRTSGSALTTASPEILWKVVTAIGGDNRYYYLNSLWTLRELMDWAIGGPGLRRGRRDPHELRVGDKLDSWEVIAIEPQRRLSLAFGMRAPGAGVLEFTIQSLPDGRCEIAATAYWQPAGVWGLLYWMSLEPAHLIIFKGLTQEIARRAEHLDTANKASADKEEKTAVS